MMPGAAALFAWIALADAGSTPPIVFEPAQVQEVYRVLLDRDALLLESITDVIQQENIRDGHVMVTARQDNGNGIAILRAKP